MNNVAGMKIAAIAGLIVLWIIIRLSRKIRELEEAK